MRIKVYSIEKTSSDEFFQIVKNYQKMIGRYAKAEDIAFFNKKIASAQKMGAQDAKKEYLKVYDPLMRGGYNIALHERGKNVDSIEFSDIFKDKTDINFFIGGAYGFEEDFLKKADKIISFGKMTLGHKVAKVVLFEQIYRALSIINGHPYHK